MAFWIACSMKAIKEQIDEQPKIIKLFSINYARDLIHIYISTKRKTYQILQNNQIKNIKFVCGK